MDSSFKDVDSGLKQLFSYAYKTNAEIEDEPLSTEDNETLADLDLLEVLENFKDLVDDFLSNKRELKNSQKAELVERNGKFESMIQKLEGDVRKR